MSLSTATPRPQSTLGRIGISGRGLALVAGFLALLLRTALFDPDYYWHIEAGRWIVVHGMLPSTDPFSFTMTGQPWITHEWLFEILLYGFFAAAGSFGAKLLSALLGIGAVKLVYAAANKVLARPTQAAWLAAAFYVFVYEFPSPRPQLLTYLFLAAYFCVLAMLKYGKDGRLLPALPLIMIAWVNAHGGYLIGIFLLAAFGLSEWLVLRASAADDGGNRRLRRFAVASALTVLATLCNPQFIAHWAYPFTVMGMEASRHIAEWWSPDFNSLLGRLYLLMVAGFCTLQIYRKRKPDLTEFAVPGLFIVAGFLANRHLPLAAMAMTVFAAPVVRDGLQIAAAPPPWILGPWRRWRNYATQGKTLGRTEGQLNLAVALALAVVAATYYPTARAGEAAFIRAKLPVDAVQFILDHRIEGRMFNSYDFGGYLIHRLYPQQRVFIDGRADMYGDRFFMEFGTMANGGPGWAALFDTYAVDYVICQRDAAIRQLLIARGDFRLVYDDATSSVLVRNIASFATIPTIE